MGMFDSIFGGGDQKTSSNSSTTSSGNQNTQLDATGNTTNNINSSNSSMLGSNNLFGSSSSGGQSFGTSMTGSTEGWKPAMDEIQFGVLPSIRDWGTQYGDGQGIYQDSMLAKQNSLVKQGQNTLLGAAGQYGNQATDLNKTLQGFLNYDPNSYQNQASRDALGANVRSQFNEAIRPGIEDMGTFSGQFGGNQQSLAMGAATAPLSRAIADSEVNLMNADRNRAMQAMGMAPGIMSTGFTEGAMQQAIGDQRSARAQLGLEDKIQQFNAPRNARLRSILEQQGMLNPLAGLASSTASTGGSSGSTYNNSSGFDTKLAIGQNTGSQIGTGTSNMSQTGSADTTSQSNSTGSGTTSGGGNGLFQSIVGLGTAFAPQISGLFSGGGNGGGGSPSFNSSPIGYNDPEFNLGIPGYNSGYN